MTSPVPPRRLMAAAIAPPLALAAALLFAPPTRAASPPCVATTVAAGQAPAATVGRAVRWLVNAERAAHGLKPLRARRQLRGAAERHGAEMVANHFFDHVSPSAGAVTDRARRAGYVRNGDYALGEDIAWGEGELSTPPSIVTAWMDSPVPRPVSLHRAVRDFGIGVITGVPVESEHPGATFVLDAGIG